MSPLAVWAPHFILPGLQHPTPDSRLCHEAQLSASHLSSLKRQCFIKGIILQIPIAWSTLETHSLAWPMNSAAALLRFVLTCDGSEAGLHAGPCIHAMPRGYQIKSKGKGLPHALK